MKGMTVTSKKKKKEKEMELIPLSTLRLGVQGRARDTVALILVYGLGHHWDTV